MWFYQLGLYLVACNRKLKKKRKKGSEVAQSCLTLGDPMDCSPPGSSIHGIFQARVLRWVANSFSKKHSLNKLEFNFLSSKSIRGSGWGGSRTSKARREAPRFLENWTPLFFFSSHPNTWLLSSGCPRESEVEVGVPGIRTVFQLGEKKGEGRGLPWKPHVTTSGDISLTTSSCKDRWGFVFISLCWAHWSRFYNKEGGENTFGT